jgi:hypothetical protein
LWNGPVTNQDANRFHPTTTVPAIMFTASPDCLMFVSAKSSAPSANEMEMTRQRK